VDPIIMLLMALCRSHLYLPATFTRRRGNNGLLNKGLGDPAEWSHALHPAFHYTGDGARWNQAPGEMPPWNLNGGKMEKRPLETDPGTKKNSSKRPLRERLVCGIKIFPFLVFCFDGATLLSMSKVSRLGGRTLPRLQRS